MPCAKWVRMHGFCDGSRGKAPKTSWPPPRCAGPEHDAYWPLPGLARPPSGFGAARRCSSAGRTPTAPAQPDAGRTALGGGAWRRFGDRDVRPREHRGSAERFAACVVQSAPPSDALAGERSDGGPEEGTAQQAMPAPYTASPDYRSSYQPAPDVAGLDGRGKPERRASGTTAGPTRARAQTQWPTRSPPSRSPPTPEPRYDGGPDEGSSASAIAQP